MASRARLRSSSGLKIHRYGDWLTADDRAHARRMATTLPFDQIEAFTLDGLAIGEHALCRCPALLRDRITGRRAARRSRAAALSRVRAADGVRDTAADQDRSGFTSAVFTHGIYVPWGLIGEVARQERVKVSTWNVAYRKRRFIFSHDDTYHHTLMSEPLSQWENHELSPAQEQDLMQYLASRREGMFDWIVFHRPTTQNAEDIAAKIGIDRRRPVIGLLTNVSWDAQLHYPANAFANMLDWLVQTCRYFATRPDLQLLVRVHPAEISGFPPSRQPILGELRKHVPTLAPNIHIVPPESGLSTYALMSLCNSAIIYGTKMGVELTAVGLPVIVAGEAWIRNKGLTHDATTPEEYFKILERLPFPERLGPAQLSRARRYAYHFFFNRMIPLPFIQPKAGYPIYSLKLEALKHLLPGESEGLDTICDGILGRGPFVLRDKAARTPQLVNS